MKKMNFILAGLMLVACAPSCAPSNGQKSNHQNLDFEYCKQLAQETQRSGKLNHNLCPGWMPDGQPVESP